MVKPVKDQSEIANDDSPLEEKWGAWGRQVEENIMVKTGTARVMAPAGYVDKVLDTVVNNLEVTNNLEIEPEVRCRLLPRLLSPSRSATRLSSVAAWSMFFLTRPAFRRFLRTGSATSSSGTAAWARSMPSSTGCASTKKRTFHHFGFTHTPEEEEAATQEGIKLLKNSPYKDHLQMHNCFFGGAE